MHTYFAAIAAPEQLNIARRLDAHTEVVGEEWLFRGATSHNGYPHVRTATSCARAHRVAYEIEHGPGSIPTGHVVDHVWLKGCRNRHCVRPLHLEAVTIQENNRRAAEVRRILKLVRPYGMAA